MQGHPASEANGHARSRQKTRTAKRKGKRHRRKSTTNHRLTQAIVANRWPWETRGESISRTAPAHTKPRNVDTTFKKRNRAAPNSGRTKLSTGQDQPTQTHRQQQQTRFGSEVHTAHRKHRQQRVQRARFFELLVLPCPQDALGIDN